MQVSRCVCRRSREDHLGRGEDPVCPLSVDCQHRNGHRVRGKLACQEASRSPNWLARCQEPPRCHRHYQRRGLSLQEKEIPASNDVSRQLPRRCPARQRNRRHRFHRVTLRHLRRQRLVRQWKAAQRRQRLQNALPADPQGGDLDRRRLGALPSP